MVRIKFWIFWTFWTRHLRELSGVLQYPLRSKVIIGAAFTPVLGAWEVAVAQ